MKKVLLAVLLIVGMAALLYAQDLGSEESSTSEATSASNGPVLNEDEEREGILGGVVRIGYSFPFISGSGLMDDYNDSRSVEETMAMGALKLALAFGFSSLSVGGGVEWDIVPHVLAPGIYIDMNFNLLSWAIMNIFEQKLVMFQLGLRGYNQFSIGWFGIEPFFGGNFVYLKLNDLALPIFLLQAGFIINLGRFSFEYGYHFSPAKYDDIKLPGLSRITFGGIVWRK
jgi:hypothetical protein